MKEEEHDLMSGAGHVADAADAKMEAAAERADSASPELKAFIDDTVEGTSSPLAFCRICLADAGMCECEGASPVNGPSAADVNETATPARSDKSDAKGAVTETAADVARAVSALPDEAFLTAEEDARLSGAYTYVAPVCTHLHLTFIRVGSWPYVWASECLGRDDCGEPYGAYCDGGKYLCALCGHSQSARPFGRAGCEACIDAGR